MDLGTTEKYIEMCASGGAGYSESESQLAVQHINHLRQRDDCWDVGLQLFYVTSNESARFFSLSLIRDYLSCIVPLFGMNQLVQGNVLKIRSSVLHYVGTAVANSTSIPTYLLNSFVTIIALCVKLEYPGAWNSAFYDILSIGKVNMIGLDLSIKILNEVTVEIMEANENRSKEDIKNNTLIKDYMRSGSILNDMVQFLCQSSISIRSSASVELANILSNRCLRCLAGFISWIDINLIVNNSILPTIYNLFNDNITRGSACACLYEIVKKGMDPHIKVKLIASIGLIQILSSAPILYASVSSTNDDDDDNDFDYEYDLGQLVDVIGEELLGCFIIYESIASFLSTPLSIDTSDNQVRIPTTAPPIQEIGPICGSALTSITPIILKLFANPSPDVSGSVSNSMTKFTQLLKTQASKYQCMSSMQCTFLASSYLPDIMANIYRQIQYPDDFNFEILDDNDDSGIIEAKKQVQKLFVNIVRIYPEMCLSLLQSVLQSLPQPLSSGKPLPPTVTLQPMLCTLRSSEIQFSYDRSKVPFYQLEGAVRLLQSFGLCGSHNSDYVNEGVFPSLIKAIHSTDIASHTHPLVVTAYYELSVRYYKFMDISDVQRTVTLLLGTNAMRSPVYQVRCRCAYFFLKMTEELQGKASMLLPTIGSFSDLLLMNELGKRGPLSLDAELHLLEAIGIITSCSTSGYTNSSDIEQEKEIQRRLVGEVVSALVSHITTALSHPQLSFYLDSISDIVAGKIAALVSVAKNHSYKQHQSCVIFFEQAASAVIQAINVLSCCENVRIKGCAYLHRLIAVSGGGSIPTVSVGLCGLLEHATCKDIEDVVGILNQLMVAFGDEMIPTLEKFTPMVLDKVVHLNYLLEESISKYSSGGSLIAGNTYNIGDPVDVIEAPHVESDRCMLQKVYLVFLNHLVVHNCQSILYTSPAVAQYLDKIFTYIMTSLQGGRGKISQSNSIVLRKSATIIMYHLYPTWGVDTTLIGGEQSSNVPSPLKTAYKAFLHEQYIPAALRLCVDNGTLDMKDAGTYVFVAEVGTLLLTMYQKNPAETIAYLQNILPVIGMPAVKCQILFEILTNSGITIVQFKDRFKKLIRDS